MQRIIIHTTKYMFTSSPVAICALAVCASHCTASSTDFAGWKMVVKSFLIGNCVLFLSSSTCKQPSVIHLILHELTFCANGLITSSIERVWIREERDMFELLQ